MHVCRAELLAIEEAAMRGWPALRSAVIDGWLWRHASGGSVRANTVAALTFTGADVEAAISEIERRYRAAGAPPRFTVSDVSAPSDLDERLAARGYVRGEDHVTMAKSVGTCAMPGDAAAVGTTPDSAWMEVYLSGLTADRRSVAPRILAGLPERRMYFVCRRLGKIVASGLSIADSGLASVQCMATLAAHQRQRCAQSVLAAIQCWAWEQGCRLLYLQTGDDNKAARALYHRCGFFVAGRYHTRALVC